MQTGVKAIVLIHNSPQLIKIVNSLKHFWPPDNFDIEVAKKYHWVFKMITFLCINYASFGYVICAGMFASTIMDYHNRTLIYSDFVFCNLQSLSCYIPMLIWQCIAMYLQIVPAALGFDAIFIIFIGYILCACDLIKAGMESLNTNDVLRRKYILKKIAQQHDFILDFINNLNDLFSAVMLLQFWCSLWSMILFLNMLAASGYVLILFIM